MADITFARVWVSGEPEPIVVAATAPSTASRRPGPPEAWSPPPTTRWPRSCTAWTCSPRATGMLLDDDSFTESVAVRRCARLLAAELADWVIVDLEQDDAADAHAVIGPDDERSTRIARSLEDGAPAARLVARRGDAPRPLGAAGARRPTSTPWHERDGLPMCGVIEASSLMCVPLDDGGAPSAR